MKTLLFVAVVGVLAALYASRAECGFCSPMPCYGSYGCGTGCLCMKAGMDLAGTCVSLD